VVRPFRVGDVRIADHVVGPLLYRAEDCDYLLFDAYLTDRRGRPVGTATVTAVVRLTQCAEWRIRTDGDQNLCGRAADPSDLDAAGTYEVHNSSWVRDVAEEQPELAKEAALHHCVSRSRRRTSSASWPGTTSRPTTARSTTCWSTSARSPDIKPG